MKRFQPYLIILILLLMASSSSAALLKIPNTQNNGLSTTKSPIKFGFWPAADPATYQPDWNNLTHVSYTQWTLNSDGTLTPPDSISRYNTVRDKAHQHNVKMIIDVFSSDSSVMHTAFSSHSQTLANNIAKAISSNGADGVCFDFETPSGSDKAYFETFSQQLHAAVKGANSNYQIVFATTSAVDDVYRNSNLNQYYDYAFLMGYDYQVWYNGNTQTGPGSPIDDPARYDVTDTINIIKQYYSTNKIIYGIPFYAYDYQCDGPNPYANRINGGAFSVLNMHDAVSGATTFGRLWDSNSSTPWYRYYVSNLTTLDNCNSATGWVVGATHGESGTANVDMTNFTTGTGSIKLTCTQTGTGNLALEKLFPVSAKTSSRLDFSIRGTPQTITVYVLAPDTSNMFIFYVPVTSSWATQDLWFNTTNKVGSPDPSRITETRWIMSAPNNGNYFDVDNITINNGIWHQVWYLDKDSVQLRYNYTIKNSLAGIGFWALGFDYGYPSIWNFYSS